MVSRGRRSQIVRLEAEPGEAILACDPTRGCNLFRRFSAVAISRPKLVMTLITMVIFRHFRQHGRMFTGQFREATGVCLCSSAGRVLGKTSRG